LIKFGDLKKVKTTINFGTMGLVVIDEIQEFSGEVYAKFVTSSQICGDGMNYTSGPTFSDDNNCLTTFIE
jgi:hypothetical protein